MKYNEKTYRLCSKVGLPEDYDDPFFFTLAVIPVAVSFFLMAISPWLIFVGFLAVGFWLFLMYANTISVYAKTPATFDRYLKLSAEDRRRFPVDLHKRITTDTRKCSCDSYYSRHKNLTIHEAHNLLAEIEAYNAEQQRLQDDMIYGGSVFKRAIEDLRAERKTMQEVYKELR